MDKGELQGEISKVCTSNNQTCGLHAPKFVIGNDCQANHTFRHAPYANYSAACIAKSEKDFLNKLKMVEEELGETLRWLKVRKCQRTD